VSHALTRHRFYPQGPTTDEHNFAAAQHNPIVDEVEWIVRLSDIDRAALGSSNLGSKHEYSDGANRIDSACPKIDSHNLRRIARLLNRQSL
jgi:hypothetical protein